MVNIGFLALSSSQSWTQSSVARRVELFFSQLSNLPQLLGSSPRASLHASSLFQLSTTGARLFFPSSSASSGSLLASRGVEADLLSLLASNHHRLRMTSNSRPMLTSPKGFHPVSRDPLDYLPSPSEPLPSSAVNLHVVSLLVPSSSLIAEAKTFLKGELTIPIWNHSHRAFLFGE